jgi:transposase
MISKPLASKSPSKKPRKKLVKDQKKRRKLYKLPYLGVEERYAIITLKRINLTNLQIAQELNCSKRTVTRISKQFNATKNLLPKPKVDVPKRLLKKKGIESCRLLKKIARTLPLKSMRFFRKKVPPSQ